MSPPVFQAEQRDPKIPTTLKQSMNAGWQTKALKLICKQVKMSDCCLWLTGELEEGCHRNYFDLYDVHHERATGDHWRGLQS